MSRMNRMNRKPPIDIIPKTIHDDQRFIDLCWAIKRYYETETPILIEWIVEWNKHVERRRLTTT